MDLQGTIEDGDDVPNYSESSDEEVEVQPQKLKEKRNKMDSKLGAKDFDGEFQFFGSSEGSYLKDEWNDISKFLKKKPKTSLDERIQRIRKEKKRKEMDDDKSEMTEGDSESEGDLSDDELELDGINVKKKRGKRREEKKDIVEIIEGENRDKKETENEDEDFFEEPEMYDKNASFQSMALSRPLLKAIESMRFVHPTPIQSATIPVALAGRDICGCAATGTGKTAAYLVPVLERLLFRSKAEIVTRVLLVVPTRELGVQVYQVSKQLCQFTSIDVALSVGGLDLRLQEAALRKSPDIVIATPGRLIDHIKNTPSFTLDSIEVLILDEADRLLEEAFLDQIKEIVKSCAPKRQTMLFSATMTDQVNELAAVSLKKPVKVFVDSNRAVAWTLQQEFVRIRSNHLKNQEAVLASLLSRTCRDHTIVFIRTKQQCHRLHIVLGLLGLRVAELHGNMSQVQRLESLRMFKEEEIDILLTTDVAARGLDISGVKTVVNFQLPDTLEQYIHRVGRTARAGRAGRSVSFATEENRKIVRQIVRHACRPVKSRVIPPQIIAKYFNKIQDLEPEVKQVIEEENAEREIAKLENRANRLQNQLKDGSNPERAWMDKRKKGKADKGDVKELKGSKRRKAEKMNMEPEEREALKEADYHSRQAKRARKPKKIRMLNDNVRLNGGKAKNKKKPSMF